MARKRTNLGRRGSSWIVYFRVDGRQVFKSFADRDYGGTPQAKDAAKLYLAQAHAELARGTFRVAPVRRFDEFAGEWLTTHPSLDPRTRELYAQRIRDYLEPVLGTLKVGEIEPRDVRRVKERAAAAGVSGWTQRGVLNLLSGIMRYALEQEPPLIASNPVAALPKRDRPKTREGGRGRKRILTTDELRPVLAKAGRFRTLFAVGAFAGLRLSEVLGLVWDDVDFDAGTIHVRAQLSVPNRFDPTPPHRVDLKSDSDEGCERSVFLADDLARLLREHRGDRIVRRDSFVFTTGAGTPFTQRNTGRAFDDALERAAVEWTTRCPCGWKVSGPATEARAAKAAHLEAEHDGEDVKWSTDDKPTFHSLRHAFASAVIAHGADQGHVARLLGHTDPSFTYRVYVHEFDKARRHAESKAALGAAYAGVLA